MRIGGGVEKAGQIPFKDVEGLITYQTYLFTLYEACALYVDLPFESRNLSFICFKSPCNFFEGLHLNWKQLEGAYHNHEIPHAG